ncbi:MAG: LON peptidase substrate-binding domain-containing protein [Rhodocyclaceae bacterium]|nr:LON peptidase substrate-binding domain-containing protein [Rhodocyclaceae bacterium]
MSLRTIPLFPLQAVLFPEGRLPLRIFEQRYMDMAKTCLREGSPFGVCLIASGQEVGKPAVPHPVGTLASIAEWDMPQLGVLQVVARGGERFRILRRWVEASGLAMGEVELLAPEATAKIPQQFARLVPMLRAVLEDMGNAAPTPPRFFDAAWVGFRWCEVLPIPDVARQKLLELEDVESRLEIVFRFLDSKGLIPE